MENGELTAMLNAYFKWNKCRMDCFVAMLLALIKVRTLNLTELACGFSSLASIESRYKRIRRFFKEFSIDFTRLASWVIYFFDLSGQSLTLSMDRTHWKWGAKNINIWKQHVYLSGLMGSCWWKLDFLTMNA